MTLSGLRGHSPIVSLCKWNFSYSYAAVDKISADLAHHAAEPLVKINSGGNCKHF